MAWRGKRVDSWTQLRGLQRVDEVWELGYRPAQIPVSDAPSPHLLMVGERASGKLRFSTMTAQVPTADELRLAAEEALRTPAAGLVPCRPTTMAVDTAATQMALALPLRRAGVAIVRVPELALIDEAVDAFHAHAEGEVPRGELPTPLYAHGELIHAAAAQLAELEPWLWLQDDELLSLRLDAGPWSAPVVAFLGDDDGGGLALYRTRESYEASSEAHDTETCMAAGAMDAIAIWFVPADEVPRAQRKAFAASGLPIGGELYPTFARIVPFEPATQATDEQSAEVLRLVLPAIVAFLDRHLDTFMDDFAPLSLRHRAADGQMVEVESRPNWLGMDDLEFDLPVVLPTVRGAARWFSDCCECP